jgi:hypothetical protein
VLLVRKLKYYTLVQGLHGIQISRLGILRKYHYYFYLQTPPSTIIQLYRVVIFIGGKKPEYPGKDNN